MTLYGMNSELGGSTIPKIQLITEGLKGIYHFNLLLLLPIAIVLYGSITKKPTIPIMLVSALVAMINASVIQGSHYTTLLKVQ